MAWVGIWRTTYRFDDAAICNQTVLSLKGKKVENIL